MKHLLTVLNLMFVVGTASAHQDQFYAPNQVQWQISESESLEISVTETGELSSVSLIWESNSYSVPSSEFEGVGPVDLRAVDYLGTDKSRIGKYRFIKIGMGSRYCGSSPSGCNDSVRFVFMGGQYESRSIYRQINKSQTQIYRKLPGSSETPGGAIHQLK